MHNSFRAFAEGIIDYAGLFPPAELGLVDALDDYRRARRDPASWMLARFIAKTSHLAPIVEQATGLTKLGAAPMRFTLLGQGGSDFGLFHEGLVADLKEIASFREQLGDRVAVDALEMRLPPGLLDQEDGEAIGDLLDVTGRWIDARGPAGLAPFYEVPAGEGFRDRVQIALDELANHAAGRRATAPEESAWAISGIKLRCGGTEAAAFPSIDDVAFVIAASAVADIPFKATAGLHHPVRSNHPTLPVKMHGFLNVFGAGILARAHGLDDQAVRPIVAEEDPAAFSFDAERFHWRDLSATTAEIREIRTNLFTGFGSCSFDEPKDDLRALGLLDADGPA